MTTAYTMYFVAMCWFGLNAAAFYSFRTQLASERHIFAFHVGTFGVYFVTVAMLWSIVQASTVTLFGLISAHAIYSLTFLWLWSGTQGSYSLSILELLLRSPTARDKLIATLSHIGEEKKRGRLSSLNRLGLITCDKGYYRVSPIGRIAAKVLVALRWLANSKDGG
jgi:hypothetical protein